MVELLAAVLVPILGAGLVFALPGRRRRLTVLVVSCAVHLVLVGRLWVARPTTSPEALLGVDAAGQLMLTVVAILYCLVAVHLITYTRRDPRGAPAVFLACHLFSLAALTVACLSTHWGLYWVAMETTTLVSAPLLFYHHGPRSLEATWKYVIIGSVGIALALLGTLFLGMAATDLPGTVNPLIFQHMEDHAARLAIPWLRIGTVFLLIGYGTKMGLAPMHTWKPDAYGEAPPPVAALLSGGVTNCAFLGLMRVNHLCGVAGEGPFARSMLVVLGLLSVGIAAACIVGQGNYRRMLAYSSVEHMGILVLALGIGGLAAFGGLLHAVNNAFNKGIMFLTAGNILQATRTSEVKEVTGLLKTLPFSAGFFVVGFLAATGFPPFGTFVSEFTILRGMFAQGEVVAPILFLLFLAIVFIGMSSIVLGMVQGERPPAGAASTRTEGDTVIALLPIIVFTAIVLVLGVWVPRPLQEILEQASGYAGGAR